MFKITGLLLETSKGEYQGNPYASVKLRSKDVVDNQILKYKLDLKKVNYDDVAKLLDQEVECDCAMVKGANDSSAFKVVAVRSLKTK